MIPTSEASISTPPPVLLAQELSMIFGKGSTEVHALNQINRIFPVVNGPQLWGNPDLAKPLCCTVFPG